ncbi:ankyrin [Trametes versicolor FP-101664 SS1]|uniref:ankyrin n=1 Tax=Trametes versicolor (strain FP-101664) TaxID=717944 RepID=UPI00046227DA|nr:ankyrin [Trametes versicolor FP-101664 SS1]EIW52467.1 ankyrin [Trametes versicolor FP-101664 SS1]
MQELIDRPGFLPADVGGSRLRSLYQRGTAKLEPRLLSDFAKWCFTGDLQAIKRAIEAGDAPDILGSETPYQHAYATFVVRGAQNIIGTASSTDQDHAATLKYLLDLGAPPNMPDIVGYTALHHACNSNPRPELARILLEGGADPNQQDHFGSVPLMGAFQNDAVQLVDLLMEHGASLDIKDGDGDTPDDFFIKAGPYITAAVQKWKRRRAGERQPLDEKACSMCAKTDVELKFCAKCGSIRYCSKECQKTDWPRHKLDCVGFNAETTVTLKPHYEDIGRVLPTADVQRQKFGYPVPKQPKRNMRSMHIPNIRPGETKKLIIKVQVPFDMDLGVPQIEETGDLMVFDRKRSLVCRIRRQDDPEGYLRISRVIRAKGVGGAKAYFSAEMERTDRLVVKVSEVLAEQTF